MMPARGTVDAEEGLLEEVIRMTAQDYLCGPECCKAFMKTEPGRSLERQVAYASAREFLEAAGLLDLVQAAPEVPAHPDVALQQALALGE